MSARISKTVRLRPEANDFDTSKILKGHNPDMKTMFIKDKPAANSSDSEDSMYENIFISDADKAKKLRESDSDVPNY
jgi:hypothetical protein